MKVNEWTTVTEQVAKAMVAGCLLLFGCAKNTVAPGDDPDGEGGGNPSGTEALFVSFKTPAWTEKIDCSHLSFRPNSCSPPPNNSVYYVTATSASTKMTFQVSYPVDSASISKLATDRQFPLRYDACEASEAMQEAISFMLVVPESKGNTNQWMPIQEMNEQSYAILKSVTYVKSDDRYAHFRVAGTYTQLSALADADRYRISDDDQVISGEFQLMVLADRADHGQ